jgi:hypothetical protein
MALHHAIQAAIQPHPRHAVFEAIQPGGKFVSAGNREHGQFVIVRLRYVKLFNNEAMTKLAMQTEPERLVLEKSRQTGPKVKILGADSGTQSAEAYSVMNRPAPLE